MDDNFNEELFGFLEEYELSLGDMSRLSNVSKSTLSNILNGKHTPSPKTLKSLKLVMSLPSFLIKSKKQIVNDDTFNNTPPIIKLEDFFIMDTIGSNYECDDFNINSINITENLKNKTYSYNNKELNKSDRIKVKNTLELLLDYLELKYPKECVNDDDIDD